MGTSTVGRQPEEPANASTYVLAIVVAYFPTLGLSNSTSLRSDKYAASVKEDCDEKTTIVQESRVLDFCFIFHGAYARAGPPEQFTNRNRHGKGLLCSFAR